MRSSLPVIIEMEKEKKKERKEIKKRITAPAMNDEKETNDLINKHKKSINNIKFCENEDQNYTFLSNLEEIVYIPPSLICKENVSSYNKTFNSVSKKSIIIKDKWDKYLEYFDP